jgi:hypothetical protein
MISAAFAPLLMAHGAAVAGLIANPIFFAGAKLTDFKMELLGAVAFSFCWCWDRCWFFHPA